jgi:hypothetical protein
MSEPRPFEGLRLSQLLFALSASGTDALPADDAAGLRREAELRALAALAVEAGSASLIGFVTGQGLVAEAFAARMTDARSVELAVAIDAGAAP